MKFISKYPPNTWDWDRMNSVDFKNWASHSGVSYELIDRWKLQNKFTKVLDLGTGLGRNARVLGRYGFDVRGLDIDANALKYARTINEMDNILNVSYDLGDMLNMPYGDNSFDAVFADNIVYLTYYDAMCRAVSEIHRVLRSNGEVFLKLLNSSCDYFRGKKRIDPHSIKCQAQYGTHQVTVCGIAYNDLPQIMSGFELIDITGQVHGYVPEAHEFLILARAIKTK